MLYAFMNNSFAFELVNFDHLISKIFNKIKMSNFNFLFTSAG